MLPFLKKILLVTALICLCLSKQTAAEAQLKLKEIAESPIVNLIFVFDSLKSKICLTQWNPKMSEGI